MWTTQSFVANLSHTLMCQWASFTDVVRAWLAQGYATMSVQPWCTPEMKARVPSALLPPVALHGAPTPLAEDDPTRLLPVDPHSLGLGFSGPLDPLNCL